MGVAGRGWAVPLQLRAIHSRAIAHMAASEHAVADSRFGDQVCALCMLSMNLQDIYLCFLVFWFLCFIYVIYI